MFLNSYYYILLKYTLVLLHQYHEHHLLAYCLNGAQFLNFTFLLAALLSASCVAVFETVIVTLTSIY